jgi:hypothetical protein
MITLNNDQLTALDNLPYGATLRDLTIENVKNIVLYTIEITGYFPVHLVYINNFHV